MSSATAMEKHAGGVAEYRLVLEDRPANSHDILNRASEGKTVEVPYRGDVNCTMLDVLGGIRSACTYTGAGKLKEMPKRTTFIRVSQQLNEVFSGGRSYVLH
jgi:GMP reductase